MAEARFTPGPWFYGIAFEPQRGPVPLDYDSGGHSYNAGIIGADGETVAGCDEYHIFGPSDPDVQKANISLIAAAPDLYEALEALVKAHELIALLSAPLLNTEPAMRALAKARGEQS